jgi:hypothetical protein
MLKGIFFLFLQEVVIDKTYPEEGQCAAKGWGCGLNADPKTLDKDISAVFSFRVALEGKAHMSRSISNKIRRKSFEPGS